MKFLTILGAAVLMLCAQAAHTQLYSVKITGDCTGSDNGTGTVPVTCSISGGGGGGGSGSLNSSLTDPTASSDPNDKFHSQLTVTYDNALGLNTGFTDANGLQITENGKFGLNSYGGGTNAKWTFLPLQITGNYTAQGQRFLIGETQNCWGNGDCFGETKSVAFWGADINGDEGQGFQSVSYLSQGGGNNNPQLTLTTISGTPTATTCNTTSTQAITGSGTAQTVSVASAAGCNAGDWIVVNPGRPVGNPNYEAVQITAVGSGTISGIFRLNQSNGVAIKPAKVVPVADTSNMGQGRMLINLSASGYITGTVSSISGGGFTGSGTNWTNSMVGDNGSPNIGCISLVADDYSQGPFNGSGNHGTLHSWYAINGVGATTSLGIFSTSVAGDAAYHGYGPGTGGYRIQPCSEVLQIVGNNLILMTTAAPWNNTDQVEEAITPFPDVTGHTELFASYTAGGALRSAYKLVNAGRRQFGTAVTITGNMPSGSDPSGWAEGVDMDSVDVGMTIAPRIAALHISKDTASDILWGPISGSARNQAIGYDSVNSTDALMLHSTNGTLRCGDLGSLCLGIQSLYPNNWAMYNGEFALRGTTAGGLSTKFRFYKDASVGADPQTATNYVDVRFAYPGSVNGNYSGLSFYDGTNELLKLDFSAVKATITGNLAVTGNSTISGNQSVGGFRSGSIAVGLTAAGTGQGDALSLAAQTNIIATASSAAGVKLPDASLLTTGTWIDVYNDGPSNSFHVYGNGSDTIDGIAANTGVTLTNNFWCRYVLTASGTWKSYRFAIVRSS